MSDISPALQRLIDDVTSDRYKSDLAEFKTKRGEVVDALRAMKMPGGEIAKLLGVSEVYLSREFPRKKKEKPQ